MYQVGERVIYGSNGVCEINEIKMIEVPHTYEEKAYYVMKPLFQDCKISVPVDTKVFMRYVITREDAESLIAQISQVDAQPYYNTALRQLQDYYETKISTHSCEDLLTLLVSLHRKKAAVLAQKRKFGAIDERYMKRVEDLLFGELAVALEMTKAEVRKLMIDRLAEVI